MCSFAISQSLFAFPIVKSHGLIVMVILWKHRIQLLPFGHNLLLLIYHPLAALCLCKQMNYGDAAYVSFMRLTGSAKPTVVTVHHIVHMYFQNILHAYLY